jgi:nuclear transport factor 2 (NTF2) superfamily protein
MPLGDEVSRDTEYHDTGQDQQRHRANNAAVQTIAREMTAHGLNPLMRSLGANGFPHGWFHAITDAVAGSPLRTLRKVDSRKWARQHESRLIKDLWAFHDNRIAVRFQYEWHDDAGQWRRSCGNEQWEFDEHGLMRRREASINDVAIAENDRRFRWAAPGPRPADVAGLGESPF